MRIPLFFLLGMSTACTNNLVKNSGAETLPFKEWTIASGKWTQRSKAPLPQEGNAYFFPSVAAHAELFQDIDVGFYKPFTDFGLVTVRYKSYMRAFPQKPADKSYEVLEFRNAGGEVVDSFATDHCDSSNGWISVSQQQLLPRGSRIIRVRLLSDRYNGSNNDGYHDGISLSLSLSYWVYVFFLLIAVGLLWLWFRKKRKRSPLPA
jgi:hypothetical protein